jgi:purine-binding chemotaxis protein CheW
MSGEPAESGPRHVLLRAGRARYALPLESVREVVVPQPPFARVPRAGPAVRGAMNLRGRVVAMIDLPALVGAEADGRPPQEQHLVLLDRGRRGLGLLVNAVVGVERLPAASAAPAAEPGALLCGTVAADGGPIAMLDPDALEARAAGLFG